MALQRVEQLLNLLDQLELKTQIVKNISVKIQNISDIEIKPITTESEWFNAHKLCTTSFGILINPKLFQSRVVIARRFLTEAYMALYQGEIVGIIMAADWGSFRLIGPVVCSAKFVRNGIASKMIHYLLTQSPVILKNKTIKREILSTFCGTFHVPMYMRHGFEPRSIAYKSSMEITSIHQDYMKRYICDKYTFKHCYDCNVDTSFVAQARNICDKIYDGWDLTELIEGNWKYKDRGSSYGLYDEDNNLVAFSVCSYGDKSEVLDATHLKLNCLVTLSDEIFCIMLRDVLETAQRMNFTKVLAEIKAARIKAFRILTDIFDFKYDPTHVRITMGQCAGTDVVYDDHCVRDAFVIDSW
eukprot:185696_1